MALIYKDSARIPQRNYLRNYFLIALLALQACAHAPIPPQTADAPTPASIQTAQLDEAKQQIAKLQDRVQDLETRLGALNDKINLENGSSPSASAGTDKTQTSVIEVPPAHGKIVPVKRPEKAKGKTSAAIASAEGENPTSGNGSESVDRFREAKILYDSKRYSDSVLEFAEYVKNEPDSPFAPAAQYYVGQSYFKQGEFKLAEEELNRGLLSYGHSSYVPDTLFALAEVSAALKKSPKVTYYKEKLLGHFANSPQARAASKIDGGVEPVSPKSETAPTHSEATHAEPSHAETSHPETATSHAEAAERPSAPAKEVARVKNAPKDTPKPFEDYKPANMMESADEPTVVSQPEKPTVKLESAEGSQ